MRLENLLVERRPSVRLAGRIGRVAWLRGGDCDRIPGDGKPDGGRAGGLHAIEREALAGGQRRLDDRGHERLEAPAEVDTAAARRRSRPDECSRPHSRTIAAVPGQPGGENRPYTPAMPMPARERTAIVTGATGQDGYFLVRRLLEERLARLGGGTGRRGPRGALRPARESHCGAPRPSGSRTGSLG